MAHFAQIENNTAAQVIVIGNCDIGGCIGEESVPLWKKLHNPWQQNKHNFI